MRDLVFTKLSTDRDRKYRTVTKIYRDNGRFIVEKCAATKEADEHIKSMYGNYVMLSDKYKDSDIYFAQSSYNEGKIAIEYLEGERFEEYLDKCIVYNKVDEFMYALSTYFDNLFLHKEKFVISDEFIKVFGNVDVSKLDGKPAIKNIDVDMIFQNVLYNGNIWSVYDYEWTFDFLIPIDYIIYRMFTYYFCTSKRNAYKKHIKCEFGSLKKTYQQMEQNFQKYVQGKDKTLADIYSDIHEDNVYFSKSIESVCKTNRIQVFYDYGNDFDIEHSEYCEGMLNDEEQYIYRIQLKDGVNALRIDPTEEICAASMSVFNDKNEQIYYIHNGFEYMGEVLFFSRDPKFVIENIKDENVIIIKLKTRLIYYTDECRILEEYVNQSVNDVKKLNFELNQLTQKLNLELNQLTLEMQDKNNKINELNIIVDEKKNEIELLNSQIQDLYNSTSWKITKPLRKLKSLF